MIGQETSGRNQLSCLSFLFILSFLMSERNIMSSNLSLVEEHDEDDRMAIIVSVFMRDQSSLSS